MRVAMVGTGYVGLVVGAGMAETGNDVVCVDVDEEKIKLLQGGQIPIYEPGLEPLVAKNVTDGRLSFSTDVGAAIQGGEIVMIAVGTPPDEDGSADLQHVLAVARTIGDNMNSPKVVVTKSTVPVGTANKVRSEIAQRTSGEFSVCSNPEFLKEGAAVEDFMKPDRVVVGVDDDWAAEMMKELYAPFMRTNNRLILMDVASAELTKYAANAMLATRISFVNEVAALCEAVGADFNMVRRGIGSDARIGPHFLFPGPGYGGSCFPKDVRALIKTGGEHGIPLDVIKAVQEVNTRQKQVLFEKLSALLGQGVADSTVAVWGLAFKAQTDDMRESPAIDLINKLVDSGARVRAHDPEAIDNAKRLFGDKIEYCERAYDALVDADALAIVTEWMAFRTPDFDRMKSTMKRPIIVDSRNLYEPTRMKKRGFTYVGIGRGASA
ncbi:UDP-glucose dehydrogenase family protein [Gemmatimonadota bacterium]